MTQKKTGTKLYKTALGLAWVWALGLTVVGINEAIPTPPKEATQKSSVRQPLMADTPQTRWREEPTPTASPEPEFVQDWAGEIRRVSELNPTIRANMGRLGFKPASPQQIQEYLHPKPNYEDLPWFIGFGLIAPVGLIALNRWWRWLRKPEEGHVESVGGVSAEIAGVDSVAPAEPSLKQPGVNPSIVDGRLSELKRLFESGLITQDEYMKKRAEILSEL
jgi:hypothetical protein